MSNRIGHAVASDLPADMRPDGPLMAQAEPLGTFHGRHGLVRYTARLGTRRHLPALLAHHAKCPDCARIGPRALPAKYRSSRPVSCS